MSLIQSTARNLSLLASMGQTAGQQNMMQLIQLRWLAVFGQVLTIALTTSLFGIQLPLQAMFGIVGGLILLNLFNLVRPRRNGEVRNSDLMAGLLLDVAALTALLYFSGGATNPFVFLYLLQVALGAVLLTPRSTWVLVGVTTLCFAGLTRYYLPLPLHSADPGRLFELHVIGMLVCFVLDVALLVVFMTRINSNLRRRDARLADLRQQAAEEDHIVRMGLLASGAAHELGTPLATLSVILGDWKRMPQFRDDADLLQEIVDMEGEVRRCKAIVTGILMSAGEARGGALALTTAASFLDELVGEWCNTRPTVALDYRIDDSGGSRWMKVPIVSDSALKQIICNVLDNAADASPAWVGLTAACPDGQLSLSVQDRGPGFAAEMLAQVGKPYQSSKGRPGGGLGLFLVVNVLRKLGGGVSAENLPEGGARVTLRLPLSALSIGGEDERST
ncbi:ATP-binding protein [Solimonas sp. K1W22B-7]|uniref:ATP-binding protein n=1 Tax=Solimonas sp. K1W22B-7 TaxID=2303331 RepID=UPI001968B9E3|nr:ATP-binding protein [Solimonas sp. K1W22B-7]